MKDKALNTKRTKQEKMLQFKIQNNLNFFFIRKKKNFLRLIHCTEDTKYVVYNRPPLSISLLLCEFFPDFYFKNSKKNKTNFDPPHDHPPLTSIIIPTKIKSVKGNMRKINTIFKKNRHTHTHKKRHNRKEKKRKLTKFLNIHSFIYSCGNFNLLYVSSFLPRVHMYSDLLYIIYI